MSFFGKISESYKQQKRIKQFQNDADKKHQEAMKKFFSDEENRKNVIKSVHYLYDLTMSRVEQETPNLAEDTLKLIETLENEVFKMVENGYGFGSIEDSENFEEFEQYNQRYFEDYMVRKYDLDPVKDAYVIVVGGILLFEGFKIGFQYGRQNVVPGDTLLLRKN